MFRFVFPALCALLVFRDQAAMPPQNWHWRNPTPSGNTLKSLAFCSDRFLAVGELGTILSSEDGYSWQSIQTSFSDNLLAVAGTPGNYVILGEHGLRMTSTNGMNWIGDHLGVHDVSIRLKSFGSVIVGCDSQGLLVHSSGLNWSRLIPAPKLGALRDIALANNSFVLLGERGTAISTNLVQWTQTSNLDLRRVIVAHGKFVASGFSKAILAESSDGQTWTTRESPYMFAFGFDGSQFIGSASSGLLTWKDEGVFTPHYSTLGPVDGIISAKGQVLGLGVSTSIAGIVRWGLDEDWHHALNLATSTDLSQGANLFPSICFDQNAFWYADDLTVYTSNDGADWIRAFDLPTWGGAYSRGNGTSVLVQRSQESTIMYLRSEPTWAVQQVLTNTILNSVAFGNGRFVAVGNDGVVFSSSNGQQWFEEPKISKVELPNITFSEGLFCTFERKPALEFDVLGSIWTSPDGRVWSTHKPPPQFTNAFNWNPVSSLIHFNGGFIGLDFGKVFSYFDGSSDLPEVTLVRNVLTGIAFGRDRFVVVGSGGIILQSDPFLQLRLSTSPQPRLDYRGPGKWEIQYSETLAPAVWTPLTSVEGRNETNHIIEALLKSTQRFYRAVTTK